MTPAILTQGMLPLIKGFVGKNLGEKIKSAMSWYARQPSNHGRAPTICYIHPSLRDNSNMPRGIEVVDNKSVLPEYFWIGMKEE